ncbi:MAG: 4Fe-4S ferredoxin [Pyrobaculum sp.]
MVEYIVDDVDLTDEEKFAVGLGLSITFRQVLVKAAPSREVLEASKGAVWGALLISPCLRDIPCFKDLEEAINYSEIYSTPVGYDGPEPIPWNRRVSTFNKHYAKAWRWARGGEEVRIGHPLLPILACLYTKLKSIDGVPIVVSDRRLIPTVERGPDYTVIPTWHYPEEVAEVVDVHLPPLKASALALGILRGKYDAGPVFVISEKRDRVLDKVVQLGGHVVVIEELNDPCGMFKKRGVEKYRIDLSLCDRCGDCLKTKCPAVVINVKGYPEITQDCTNCGACAIVCTRGAIS